MKLKIISDGTANGTRVVSIETGEAVGGVDFISWSASVDGEFCEAQIHLLGVPCEIVGKAVTIISEDLLRESPFTVSDDEPPTLDISELLCQISR